MSSLTSAQKNLFEREKEQSEVICEDDNGISSNTGPLPFVKWAGGKRCLLKELVPALPDDFHDYYEPFVGGGALFFSIYKKLERAYLSDHNLELVITYQVIKNDPDKLIDALKNHQKNHDKEYYYKIRSQHENKDPIKRAARLIYLNKTCYNGLFRVNKEGKFNVPMGSYSNPRIVDEPNIWLCHEALESATIEYREFDTINPKKDDFVYCDPPYHPTDEISFTSYTRNDFTEKDQIRLRDFALDLTKKNVKVMLSNSNTKFIRDIYAMKPFIQNVVMAPRFVNCKKDGRNPVEELLITTYKTRKNITDY